MLTQQTQIPTHARGKVRALVKSHKGFTAFLLEKDLISARAKNRDASNLVDSLMNRIIALAL